MTDAQRPPERDDDRGPLNSVAALTIPNGGCVEHPEFVVYNGRQTLPEFAIWYRHAADCWCTHCHPEGHAAGPPSPPESEADGEDEDGGDSSPSEDEEEDGEEDEEVEEEGSSD